MKSAIRFRILDAKLASYGAADYLDYLRTAIGTAQKKHVEGHDWESPREDTRSIGSEVSQNIDAFAAAIGVKVVEYEVRDMELGN